MSDYTFEVCLQSVDGVAEAIAGGATRVELCSSLIEGGLTPSAATIELAVAQGAEVIVMIRPRGGDFCYTERELCVMEADIERAVALGAGGVVFGMLTPEGDVARSQVQRLLKKCGTVATVFHRAIDVCRDRGEAMEVLVDMGISRILTSGGAPTVPEGLAEIGQMIEQARGRIEILPGCGILAENVRSVVTTLGVRQFHATAFRRQESRMQYRNARVYMGLPGLPEYACERTSAEEVKKFFRALL